MLSALFRSGLSVMLLRALNVILGFGLLVILTRWLGPEGLGLYAYATTLLLLLGIPVSYGWAPLVLREAARAPHDGNWDRVKGLALRGSQIAVIVTILALFIGLILMAMSRPSNLQVLSTWMIAGLAVVLLFEQLSALRTSLLRGLGFAVAGQLPEMIIKPVCQIAGLLIVAALATDGAGIQPAAIQLAIAALAAATVLSFVAGALILGRSAPQPLKSAAPQFETRRWLSSSGLFASSAVLTLVNANVDLLLLGLFRGVAEVGYYKVALQVSLAGALAYTSLNMIAVQKFASAHAAGNIAELQQTATHLARLALIPAAAVFVALLLAGDYVVPLAFGSGFVPAIIPMIILSAAQLVNAGSGMGRSLLMMSGNEDRVMVWTGIGLIANILTCVLLIPSYGGAGAASGQFVSLAVWNGGIWWETWRSNRVDASALGRIK